MNEPEDPGGTVPQASYFVTLAHKSDMDTEGSFLDTDCSDTNKTKRKRSSARRMCKHCNKRKRRNHNQNKNSNDFLSDIDCHCNVVNDENVLKTTAEIPSPHSVPILNQNNTSNPRSLHSNDVNNSAHTPIGRLLYQASDAAPYIVHIQKEKNSENDNNNMIHPVALGRFLKKYSFKNIINGSLKKIGRNKAVIGFSNFIDANNFINNDTLKQNYYKAFIPTHTITRMGVVRGIPADWTDDEVISNISVPIGCGNILKIRRFKRKVINNGNSEFVPTETVVLTFDGQVLPKRVYLCYNSLPVNLYIFPTIQCFKCCRYGHIKAQCRSVSRCFKCGSGHSGENCSIEEDDVRCCLCSGSHMATDRKCPEYSRQKNIKESMAKNCISYAEALKLHPSINKSYADVLISTPSLHNNMIHLNNNAVNNIPDRKSYKKTVFLKPKAPHHNLNKGYDRAAHESLINEFNIPSSSNGVALKNNEQLNTSLNNMALKDLIIALIQSLSSNNLISPLSHAATSSNNGSNFNNEFNGQSDPVELQKY